MRQSQKTLLDPPMRKNLTVYIDKNGAKWQWGDVREDGYRFIGIGASGKALFSSPKSFEHRLKAKRDRKREEYKRFLMDEKTLLLREEVRQAQLKLRQHIEWLKSNAKAKPAPKRKFRPAQKFSLNYRTAEQQKQLEKEKRKRGAARIKKTAVLRRVEMRPSYISNVLKIPVSALTPDLLEAKRLQLAASRKIKSIV